MNTLNILQVNPHVLGFNKTSNHYSLLPSITEHIVKICNPRAEKKLKKKKNKRNYEVKLEIFVRVFNFSALHHQLRIPLKECV